MSFAARHWYRLSPVSVLLVPVGLLFRFLAGLRRLFYRLGVLPSARLRVPVIVVGNLTVGGTGKTPLILALAEALRRKGRRPGILSRGYGGAPLRPWSGGAGDAAERGGREPLLLAQPSGCPVWLGAAPAAARPR